MITVSNPLLDIGEGNIIDIRSVVDKRAGKQQFYVHLPSALADAGVVIHANNLSNQIVGVRNRVIAKMPIPTPSGLQIMQVGVDAIIKHLPRCPPEEMGAFYRCYGGSKRRRYEEAHARVLLTGISKKGCELTAFIKSERMSSQAKRSPDPRVIQFRDARYCVLLARYLKPMEHHLYGLTMVHPTLRGSTRLVGKGLNQVERAKLLLTKMNQFRDPVVLSLDCSRFDLHVSAAQLRLEHSVYTSCWPFSPELRWLLKQQLRNVGRTRLGVRYVVNGTRSSGDMNTALGNCIIMIAMVVGVFSKLGIVGDLLDDGDDCLAIMESCDAPTFRLHCPALFLEMGHVIKVENVASEMCMVNWCQSCPIETHRGWKFVRDPRKVLNTSLVGTRWLGTTLRVRQQYLSGIADCELVLNSGVPVLAAYAAALKRNSGGAEARYDRNSGEWARYVRESRLYKRHPIDMPISDKARLDFAKAFGWSILDQLDAEERLGRWVINLEGDEYRPPCVDPVTWATNVGAAVEDLLGYYPRIHQPNVL